MPDGQICGASLYPILTFIKNFWRREVIAKLFIVRLLVAHLYITLSCGLALCGETNEKPILKAEYEKRNDGILLTVKNPTKVPIMLRVPPGGLDIISRIGEFSNVSISSRTAVFSRSSFRILCEGSVTYEELLRFEGVDLQQISDLRVRVAIINLGSIKASESISSFNDQLVELEIPATPVSDRKIEEIAE